MSQQPGSLIVLTGPSGVGKGSLRQALSTQLPGLKESVSTTTREKRPGEQEGLDYYFVARQQFETMIAQDALIEWAEFAGHYYGTPKAFLVDSIGRGESVLMEIEVQGALQIRAILPEAHLIFIEPPSLEALESRLRGRGTNEEPDIRRRLKLAVDELAQKQNFDYVIINDDFEQCKTELLTLIRGLLPQTLNRVE